jgi:hypothetical protein
MKKIAVFSMALLLMGMVAAAHAGFTVITSYDVFLSYCADPVVENFEDNTLVPGLTINAFGNAGTIADGVYRNIVDNTNVTTEWYQEFVYSPGSQLFGSWFDLSPGGEGSSIDVFADDVFAMNVPRTTAGQFYGFYSTDKFTEVTFRDGLDPNGNKETYALVDMQFCPAPIPGSLLLLGSGVLGLVGIGIRRKSA